MDTMKKNTPLQSWMEQDYLPWKQAVAAYKDERAKAVAKLVRHADDLKHILGLLLDGRPREAVRVWNRLELDPPLEMLEFDSEKDTITFYPEGREKVTMDLKTLLTELQTLVG